MRATPEVERERVEKKLAKHCELVIDETSFSFAPKAVSIAAKAVLDGLYIIREAWRELVFADTDQEAKATRDPVAPATRCETALAKVSQHTLDNGTPAHSSSTLMADLATLVRNTCRSPLVAADAPTFDILIWIDAIESQVSATSTRYHQLTQANLYRTSKQRMVGRSRSANACSE
ncbi:MAG: hypothetical protein JNM54_04120 [Candidatus Accumulibacter sp.]|uniref:hypothetical protein n=1 Tax=unclassified Candidatus Accumulibacter TaxID=2619054 RepID=UPI001A6438F6|nr:MULTISPECIES: hypothetical protein [unclassified Candidatus Accumulibacter]MBL8367094.1 hypothetical protein [Accumulibacter sp.]MBN8515865.1 hypothetical protein [Accumulibacter sp.]MBO3702995.1 hypothetical protein [Accumulibacter sp.]HRE71286.1 hypothetical protein [Accumulibacter sp.]HRE85131.1 hypothetical protein [Accumulibacter sp.]